LFQQQGNSLRVSGHLRKLIVMGKRKMTSCACAPRISASPPTAAGLAAMQEQNSAVSVIDRDRLLTNWSLTVSRINGNSRPDAGFGSYGATTSAVCLDNSQSFPQSRTASARLAGFDKESACPDSDHSRWFVRDTTRRAELERRALDIAEQERQRIGRDLHDDLCQQLTGIEFLSQTLAHQLLAQSPAQAERAREIAQMVREAITHTRDLARGLSLAELETRGLAGALDHLARRTRKLFKVKTHFCSAMSGFGPAPVVGIHLYRIAQEAVGNALKHGRARRIDISLARRSDRLVLTVKDDGLGLPLKPCNGNGMGLRAMQYRARAIGGTVAFQRNQDAGTTVSCSVRDAFAHHNSRSIL
jgi:signal transduction histidine kinase